jgi:hypothetical protein
MHQQLRETVFGSFPGHYVLYRFVAVTNVGVMGC